LLLAFPSYRSNCIEFRIVIIIRVPLSQLPKGMESDDSAVQYAIGRSDTVAPGVGIDLEFDADVQTMSPEASEYETCYVTSHKGPCRVATYSRDGQLIATGSADASIKILDTERMLAKSAMPIEVSAVENAFPLLRVFCMGAAAAVAQEVRAVVWQLEGCWFDPRALPSLHSVEVSLNCRVLHKKCCVNKA